MIVSGLLARALRNRKVRPWLTALGVATCTVLVLTLAGGFHSVQNSMASYAGQPAVDLWIAPPGSDNLIRGSFSSLVPLALIDSVRTIPGVQQVQPVLNAFLPIQALTDSLGEHRYTLLALAVAATVGIVLPGGGPAALRIAVALLVLLTLGVVGGLLDQQPWARPAELLRLLVAIGMTAAVALSPTLRWAMVVVFALSLIRVGLVSSPQIRRGRAHPSPSGAAGRLQRDTG